MRQYSVCCASLSAGSLFAQVPEIAFDSAPNLLKLPEHIHLGEAAGVATNSKGNIFVYTRTGAATLRGGSRSFTHGGSRLFEFDRSGKFVREIGQGVYGFLFAQSVTVDPQDNIWVVDRGSNMVIKFDPDGRIAMTMSRKPESVNAGGGGRGRRRAGAAATRERAFPGDNFNKPTDVAWDAAGNIFVSDGYGNSRVVKFDRNGKFLKSWGYARARSRASSILPLSIAVDAQGQRIRGRPREQADSGFR